MIILSCHCMRDLKMDSLIMDKKISFAQDFQLNHVFNPTSSSRSSSSIGEEDHDESFDDDVDEDEEEVNSLTSPLQDMSCLLQQLPFKRGLSKHYNGKSQSFTSLLNVASLEDLAKPENPLNKKLKSCKSYGVFPRTNSCSKVIGKRPSAAGFALVVNNGARNSSKNCNN